MVRLLWGVPKYFVYQEFGVFASWKPGFFLILSLICLCRRYRCKFALFEKLFPLSKISFNSLRRGEKYNHNFQIA